MAAPHEKARSTKGKKSVQDEAEEVHQLIEKCLQLYMDREEIAATLEDVFGFNPDFTREVYHNLEQNNPEFFQNYHTRLVLKQQIIRFNELLEQQYRAMLFPLVPAEQQTSMELAETAPQANSPMSETSNMNEAESSKPPTNPVGFSGSEEVMGPDPNPMFARSLDWSWLGGQGARRNTALDTAHMPILQVSNLMAGGNPTANFREPVQSSPVMAQSLSQSGPNPEVYYNLEQNNPELLQNYHSKLELKQQIIRFNELLKQQYRAMNFPVVPAELQMSVELTETAPRAASPVSETSNMNEAESSKPPANPVGFSGSEEVTGPDPNPMLGGSLDRSWLGGQGMRGNTALDAAHMPISRVSNLIAGGNPTANFREHVQSLPVMSRAESSKPPANPVGFSGSEEVTGPDPNPMFGRSLHWSWLGGQGMRRNTALDAAHMPISQVSNLMAGGNPTANFRKPVQSSPVMARSLSQSDPNPEASDQKDHANFASSGQGSKSAHR